MSALSAFTENCDALRWLREHCHAQLTKWEQGFVDDLADRLENGELHTFTPKQAEVLDRLWEQYVVHRA